MTGITINNIILIFESLLSIQKQNLKKNEKLSSILFKIRYYNSLLCQLRIWQIEHTPNTVITNITELSSIPELGKKTLQRIEEMIETGTLTELANINVNDVTEENRLLSVTGFGPSKVKEILSHGLTLDSLLNNTSNTSPSIRLTNHQLLGLKHYYDLQHRIERKHIDLFILQLVTILPEIKTIVCGSYRRGALTSGDIDILLCCGNKSEKSSCLKSCVTLLKKKDILVDDLISLTKTKYMGFAHLDDRAHVCRIDIRCVSDDEYIPAMLYFTGSKQENLRLRKLCKTKNMKLNEYGLFDLSSDKIIPLKSEQELYNLLNEPYKQPTER